jgi:hypothetical protein
LVGLLKLLQSRWIMECALHALQNEMTPGWQMIDIHHHIWGAIRKNIEYEIIWNNLYNHYSLYIILFYPALVLFEQSNCIDCINVCYIRSVIKI